ncbi:MAG: cytochrome c oxidase subunit 3, partial [Pseudomonadota bacterium]
MGAASGYYVPHEAKWPIVGSIGLFAFFWGFADVVNGTGWWAMALGAAIVIYMMFGWFALVVRESEGGIYNAKVDVSFRMSMGWFIFSEVMFFAAFFGALFYARQLSGPWLGGDGNNAMTNAVLYPGFD